MLKFSGKNLMAKNLMAKKLLLFSNLDQHFYAHLLPIALAAKDAGYNVSLLTNITNYAAKIKQSGIEVIPLIMSRDSVNPFLELFTLFKIIQIIRKENPDILHNFTIKPIMYGSIACLFVQNKKMKIFNNFLGMGFIFINQTIIYSIVRKVICTSLSLISRVKKLPYIVQHFDDKKLLIDCKVTQGHNISVQCSVGVNTQDFPLLPEPKGKIIFALIARMLVDKGVYEFVAAAEILRKKGLDAEFWLVGSPDEGNKASVSSHTLDEFNKQGYVKYLGFQDVATIWEKAHVAVLPSYREGISRSLLEAGAYGRAIITADAPGGSTLITNYVNGLLVPLKAVKPLADAMELLITDDALRNKLRHQIRQDVINNYDANFIAKKMISFYQN